MGSCIPCEAALDGADAGVSRFACDGQRPRSDSRCCFARGGSLQESGLHAIGSVASEELLMLFEKTALARAPAGRAHGVASSRTVAISRLGAGRSQVQILSPRSQKASQLRGFGPLETCAIDPRRGTHGEQTSAKVARNRRDCSRASSGRLLGIRSGTQPRAPIVPSGRGSAPMNSATNSRANTDERSISQASVAVD